MNANSAQTKLYVLVGGQPHTSTQLGKPTKIPASPDVAVIDAVTNPHPDLNYVARFTFPEFTSLCPVTGQPDFALLVFDYVPDLLLVESKSLKLFLNSFRNHAAFHEDCTGMIAFWNAHHDERGFASMHIYHVASGTPVATILRPARTPKGAEVKTVVKHVTKRLRKHWPNTRMVWRGDSHYGRVEAMEWAEGDGADYIFGLPGNAKLDAQVAETADNLRFHHAKSSQAKLRTYTSFTYQAGSWTQPRKVVARLECSLQPDAGETTSTGMRQEVDIRYVVTSLKGAAQHLYENVYCQRGQMENLIKLHKAQLASDRMSCHSATANQVRLVLHTAAFWLMHGVRAAIPKTDPLARAEFATIRDRLIKIGARVIEHIARIRVQLPTSCPERALFRAVALGLTPSGP
jgi:7-cyano-7-deazaguanine reductase